MPSIVVIEDNLPVLQAILETLHTVGFDVTGASGGHDGVKIVRQHLPDLVLCDIAMPEFDGYEVLQTLRGNPRTQTIPFIFLTAKSGREDMRRGMELGADDFITKPFSTDELLASISIQLKKRTTLDQRHETTLSLLRKKITYVLPHELRTPLAIVLGSAEILIEDYYSFEGHEVIERLEAIQRSGHRLQRLIENYLIYAQIELTAMNPKHLSALRNHIIKDSAQVIAEQAAIVAASAERQSDLRLETCESALQISKDDLKKIVWELVDNAFKFSKPGTPVEVQSSRSRKAFTLTIRDYGRGMTAEQIANIGAYMQFERTVYEQQGVGLGLVIAKRLVELHRGEFEIDSAPDKGTYVTVWLPV